MYICTIFKWNRRESTKGQQAQAQQISNAISNATDWPKRYLISSCFEADEVSRYEGHRGQPTQFCMNPFIYVLYFETISLRNG
jgi:hypothetical protein